MQRDGVPAPAPRLSEFVDYLAGELGPETLGGVLEFGSHATGEAVPGSDHDLLVLVRGRDTVTISPPLADSAAGVAFREAFPGVRLIREDVRDGLNEKWARNRDPEHKVWISHPLVDLRWAAHVLALESNPLFFHHVTAGRVVFDPDRVLERLQGTMRRERPFHLGEGGMVRSLEHAGRDLRRDLASEVRDLAEGVEREDPEHELPWIHAAAALVRTATACWTLVTEGHPRWTASEVMETVDRAFPRFGSTVARTYALKASRAGRRELAHRLRADRVSLVRELRQLTKELLELSELTALSGHAALAAGTSPLPKDDPGRVARMRGRYLRLLGVPSEE